MKMFFKIHEIHRYWIWHARRRPDFSIIHSINSIGIELEKDLNLALITIEPHVAANGNRISSFRVGSSKIQPSDRWLSLAWKANTSTFGTEECSFKNGTCNPILLYDATTNATQEIEGWPIVSKKKSSWKNTLIVGLLQNTPKEAILIDNEGIKWIARIVAQSVQIQYLPSCRGPGKLGKEQKELIENFSLSLAFLVNNFQIKKAFGCCYNTYKIIGIRHPFALTWCSVITITVY